MMNMSNGMSMNMPDMNKSGSRMEDGHMMPEDGSLATMSMQMVFYLGVDVTVLFSQWKVCTFKGGVPSIFFWEHQF